VEHDTTAVHEVGHVLGAGTPDTTVLAIIKAHVKTDVTEKTSTGKTETTRLRLARLVVDDTTMTLLHGPAAKLAGSLAAKLLVNTSDELLEHTRNRTEDRRTNVLKHSVQIVGAQTLGADSREEGCCTRTHGAVISQHLLRDLSKRKQAQDTISLVETGEGIGRHSGEGNIGVAELDTAEFAVVVEREDDLAKILGLGLFGDFINFTVTDIGLGTIFKEG